MIIGLKFRTLDDKRRLIIPAEWVSAYEKTKNCVIVKEKDSFRIYLTNYWLSSFNVLDDDGQEKLSAKSTYVVLNQRRILLPKSISYKKVMLIGMKNYFLLKRSDK